MYRLTATYKIELPNQLRVKRSKDDPLRYTAVIEEFDVEVVLVCNGGASFKAKGDLYETRAVTRIDVSISRDEDSAPPDVPVRVTGSRDFTDRASWFSKRRDEYRRIAVEAVNRVIRFFKYEMKTPSLQEFSVNNNAFCKPQWINISGKEFQTGIIEFTGTILSPPGPEHPIHLDPEIIMQIGCIMFLDDEDRASFSPIKCHRRIPRLRGLGKIPFLFIFCQFIFCHQSLLVTLNIYPRLVITCCLNCTHPIKVMDKAP